MGWADYYIRDLKRGETVSFRPRGNSMKPKISSGQLCTVEPVGDRELEKDDIVLCQVRGNQYLHLVSAVKDDLVQISNNRGHINGWTSKKNVFGILVSVEN